MDIRRWEQSAKVRRANFEQVTMIANAIRSFLGHKVVNGDNSTFDQSIEISHIRQLRVFNPDVVELFSFLSPSCLCTDP